MNTLIKDWDKYKYSNIGIIVATIATTIGFKYASFKYCVMGNGIKRLRTQSLRNVPKRDKHIETIITE